MERPSDPGRRAVAHDTDSIPAGYGTAVPGDAAFGQRAYSKLSLKTGSGGCPDPVRVKPESPTPSVVRVKVCIALPLALGVKV